MFYTVEQASIKLNVSKQSIYNKLKLKEFKDKVFVKQGKKYIDDNLLNLIKDSLNFKGNLNNDDNLHISVEDEKAQDLIDDQELLKLNITLMDTLMEQLKIKDKQIDDLNNRLAKEQELTKNMQVLQLKQQPQDIKALEEHFTELDNKLLEIKERMKDKKQRKGFLSKIFRNNIK
jgi:hypothetical protein